MRGIILTRNEKKIIWFVVMAFLLGLAVKVYREHLPRDREKQPEKSEYSRAMVRP